MMRTIRTIQFYAIFGLPFMVHAMIELVAYLTGWTRPLSRSGRSHDHVKIQVYAKDIIADPGFSTDDCYESGYKTSINARSAKNDSPCAIK